METENTIGVSAVSKKNNLELKQRIIETTFNLFIKSNSIKSLTLDNIAKEIGISKKTIYTIYKDKENLIKDMYLKRISEFNIETRNSLSQIEDPLDKIKQYFFHIFKRNNLNASFIEEFRKLYPRIWDEINRFRLSEKDLLLQIIKDGIQKGLIVENINPETIVNVIFNSMVSFFEQMIRTPDFKIQDSIDELFEIVRNGVYKK
jgi:AcrR family transcriptional regulator